MPVTKITLSTAMRARDVSRPHEQHLAAAEGRGDAVADPGPATTRQPGARAAAQPAGRAAGQKPAQRSTANDGAANHGAANHGAANHGAANHGATAPQQAGRPSQQGPAIPPPPRRRRRRR